MSTTLTELLNQSYEARSPWLETLQADPDAPTDAWRLLHGAVEGRPGLTIDRYGPILLVQSFRAPPALAELAEIEAFARDHLTGVPYVVWNHRGSGRSHLPDPDPMALREYVAKEHGQTSLFMARHRGQDPWLFLDFRAGRRALREAAEGRSVLNLFSYTGTAGVAAALGGATEVWNVDFASTGHQVAEDNIRLNNLPKDLVRNVQADVIPTVRQLAGLPLTGRIARLSYPRFEARTFDLVVLDPPTFSKGPFGAVDLVRDYQGLFKPALMATSPGGAILATNHVSTVDMDDWLESLRRCATKAGRPLVDIEVITPDPDFPSPDGKHPLKMAWCRV